MKVKELIKELRQRHPESFVLLSITPFKDIKQGITSSFPLIDIVANDRTRAGCVLLTGKGVLYGDK